jgi:HEAT repeat protein
MWSVHSGDGEKRDPLLASSLGSGDETETFWALCLLLRLDVHAAVRELTDAIFRGNPETRAWTLSVLEVIGGEKSWFAAFDLLVATGSSLRPRLVELLSSLGEEEGIGIDRLLKVLASSDRDLRRAAATVLARYQANGYFDGLDLFDHEDEEVCRQAVETLAWNGTLTVEIFDSKVIEYLKGARTDSLRRAACQAAAGLGPEAEKAVPYLISLVEREPWEGQESAVEALVAASPEDALPVAIRSLEHDGRKVREAAVTALSSFGNGAIPALPALRIMAREETDPEIARRATALVTLLESRTAGSSGAAR